MFASRTTVTIPIPFDPPHTVTLQRLPGRHLRTAEEQNRIEAMAYVERMGGEAFRKQLEAVGDTAAVKEAMKEAQADPLNGYHKPTLIKFGVKAWTCEEEVGPAAFDDLEDEAIDFLAREVLRITKPALFIGEETARKNASSGSTAT